MIDLVVCVLISFSYVFHPDKHRISLIIQIKELTYSKFWVFLGRNPERKKRIGKKSCYNNDHKKITQWPMGQPRAWKTK